uniref:glycosyltransferase family 2 protein n=1 Tax=Fluviicola sp. TaxID=1917219 RepID=UPI0040498E4C
MEKETVAVVILNWNGVAFLQQFLPTVLKYSLESSVIIADNASTDESVDWLKANYPELTIVQNNENGGFAKGYNDALRKIDATYYLLLNSDVEVTENWLEPLRAVMDDPSVAACQPKIKAFHNQSLFEHAGAAGGYIDALHYPFCRGRLLDHVETDTNQYDYPSKVFWTSGACMLIRSEVYWKLDGFDERFFAHMEEIDLCWRIQRLGYSLMVVPTSIVYHVGGGTLNYNSPSKTFLNFRNNLLMIHKNQPSFVGLVIVRRLLLDGIAGGMYVLKGQFKHCFAIIKAHFSFYNMLPSSQKERKKWKSLPHKALAGTYNGSILWAVFFQRITAFSKLNQRKLH